jgi:hypothetical protein
VYSSDQAALELISSFTVWSPLRSELSVKFFLLWGEGCSFAHSGVLLPESANRVCFYYCQFCQFGQFCQFCQFCQHSFLLSTWVCIVCVLPRCFQLFEQRHFILVVSILWFEPSIFCIFRTRYFGVILVFFGGSYSESTLWNTGAGFLSSCRCTIFSFVLKTLPDRSFWRWRLYFEFNLEWIFDCIRFSDDHW